MGNSNFEADLDFLGRNLRRSRFLESSSEQVLSVISEKATFDGEFLEF